MGLNKYHTAQLLLEILDVHLLSEAMISFITKAGFPNTHIAACFAAPQLRGRRASGLRWMQPYSRASADAYRRAISTLASAQWYALDTIIMLVILGNHSLAFVKCSDAFSARHIDR